MTRGPGKQAARKKLAAKLLCKLAGWHECDKVLYSSTPYGEDVCSACGEEMPDQLLNTDFQPIFTTAAVRWPVS